MLPQAEGTASRLEKIDEGGQALVAGDVDVGQAALGRAEDVDDSIRRIRSGPPPAGQRGG